MASLRCEALVISLKLKSHFSDVLSEPTESLSAMQNANRNQIYEKARKFSLIPQIRHR